MNTPTTKNTKIRKGLLVNFSTLVFLVVSMLKITLDR